MEAGQGSRFSGGGHHDRDAGDALMEAPGAFELVGFCVIPSAGSEVTLLLCV